MDLFLPEEELFPPWFSITLDRKRVLTTTAAPDFKLLVIVGLGTAAAGTPRPNLPRGFFIHFFPIII